LAEILDNARHHVRLRRWEREHAWGRRAEDLAHRYLERHGMTIVARNYRRRAGGGELDLVAWDGPTIVFVEVKARSNELFRSAEANIGQEKQEHLILAASEYIRRAHLSWEQARFDIVTVVFEPRPVIRHIRDAFTRVM